MWGVPRVNREKIATSLTSDGPPVAQNTGRRYKTGLIVVTRVVLVRHEDSNQNSGCIMAVDYMPCSLHRTFT